MSVDSKNGTQGRRPGERSPNMALAREMREGRDFGKATLYLSNIGALGAERIRSFSGKNGVDNNATVLGLSEFLVERSLFSSYSKGFKGFEVSLNEVIAKNPAFSVLREMSGWEAMFGRSWRPLSIQEDEDIKTDLRRSFAESAQPRSVDGEFRAQATEG